MGAVSSIYMAFLQSGDHIVSTDAVYGPSRVIMETYFKRFGVESTYINTADLNAVKAAIKPNTKMLYLETPTNPTMALTDIKAASEIAQSFRDVSSRDRNRDSSSPRWLTSESTSSRTTV